MDQLLNLCPEPADYVFRRRLLGCVVPKVPFSHPLHLHHLAELAGEQELRK